MRLMIIKVKTLKSNLNVDKANGRHFVNVYGFPHYVELTKISDKGPIRARFSV